MKRLVPMLAASLAASGCQQARPADPDFGTVWVRLPAVGGRPGALYFVGQGGTRDVRIKGVASARFARAELHESRMSRHDPRAMQTMVAIDHVEWRRGTMMSFIPAGRHFMLFGLDPALRPGERFRVRFSYEDESGAKRAEADALAIGAGDADPVVITPHTR